MDVGGNTSNEKRLIDVNDIYSLFNQSGIARLHVSDIDTIPRVDAVEVVRCRECFYYTSVNDKIGKCVFLIGEHQYVVPDGYCYLGERKEGAD